MGRKYDVVDVLAAIGLAATLFGGYLLVTAADGFWQRPPAPPAITVQSSDLTAGIQYLQPVLGQAMVDEFVRDREAAATLTTASNEFERAVDEYQRMETALLTPLALAELSAMGQAADHQARVQYVMGRSIVNATQRGVRTGTLSAARAASPFNDQLILSAQAIGHRMQEQFELNRQPILGRMIVETVQEEARLEAAAQERIGIAVVRQTMTQADYDESKAAGQTQLASATVAAIRSNALQERLERLAMLEAGPEEMTLPVAHGRIAPEIEYGYLVLACLALVALFVGALSSLMRRPEEDAMPMWKVEALLRLHRSAG
jgi:hypothetical protein